MSIPISQFIPPYPLSSGKHKIVSYVCNSICFIEKFICTFFLDSTYKWYHMVFVFVWLTSLSVGISRSIYVVANDMISFLFMAE